MTEPHTIVGRTGAIPLPTSVLHDFNLKGDPSTPPEILIGGEGTTYLVQPDGVVLKPASNAYESDLICRISEQLAPNPKFQIPTPIRSTCGSYICNGWSASTYVPEARPLDEHEYTLSRFRTLLEISDAFHDSLGAISLPEADINYLRNGGTHVWAHAHHAVWSNETNPQTILAPFAPTVLTNPGHEYVKLISRLVSLSATKALHNASTSHMQQYETSSQLIHGDIVAGNNVLFPLSTSHMQQYETSSQLIHGDIVAGNNVLFPLSTSPTQQPPPPTVIDLSPTHAPKGYAEGIFLADALTWHHHQITALDLVNLAGGPTPPRLDMIRRGLLFRCLSDIGLIERGHSAAIPDIVKATHVTALLEEWVADML